VRTPSSVLVVLAAAVFSVLAVLGGATVSVADPTDPADTEVTLGSTDTVFPQNAQHGPSIAVDPSKPSVFVAGETDNIDQEACAAGDPTLCDATAGVGRSGVQFSLDRGASWVQPTYTGYSARGCLGPDACVAKPDGPIGTVPGYAENGMASDGGPALAFGPRPGQDGRFSWEHGSRLYYVNLARNFTGQQTFPGEAAVTVSRTDDVAAAAGGARDAWQPPVVVALREDPASGDTQHAAADNAESSRYFGSVYVCTVGARGQGPSGAATPVLLARSTDGGATWSTQQVSAEGDTKQPMGRQGCQVATDSAGTVYVFWSGYDAGAGRRVIYQTRSSDGGQNFEPGRTVAATGTIGRLDPSQRRATIDGVAGAPANVVPAVAIANGAPTGQGATDRVVLAWSDTSAGEEQETTRVVTSTDRGDSYSDPHAASQSGDRAGPPAIAISPQGTDVYLVYLAHLDPWRDTTADSRRAKAVIRHAPARDLDTGTGGTDPGSAWHTLHRKPVGDARGSSSDDLAAESLGDHLAAVATRDLAAVAWTDAREAATCPAIDTFRQAFAEQRPVQQPAPQQECPQTFGNTSVFAGVYDHPTP